MLRPLSRPAPSPAEGPGRLWGLAVARAAQHRLDLPVHIGESRLDRTALAPFLAGLPDLVMILRLEGRQEARGLAVLSPDAFAALVEMHTMRRLRPAPPAARRPTRTDAAIVAPIIDLALDLLSGDGADGGAGGGAGGGIPGWATGWRYGAFAPDPRPLGLTMPDVPYLHLATALELGADRSRGGDIALFLPEGRTEPPEDPAERRADWSGRMEAAALSVPAEVRAVLWRFRLPLAAAIALSPGRQITLPATALAAVRIEGRDGSLTATGRLGQFRGARAVRLAEVCSGGQAPSGDTAATAFDAAGIAPGVVPPPAGAGPGGLPDLPLPLRD
ncbi:MAG: FliM/FliN family flagellar motor switch protein [Pseudomonadota bacterium]